MLFRTLLFVLAGLLLGVPPALANKGSHDAAARRALAWLLEQDDLLDVPAANGFSSGKALCAAAMTGFLLEQYPRRPGFAKHRARLREQLAAAIRNGAAAQGTWSDGLFGLYLAERQLRGARRKEDDEKETIASLAARIAGAQNADGGWGHGGLAVSFYPTTLIAATNLSVLALGLAGRLGIAVDDAVVADARRLYRDLQSPSGAWPYGGRPYRKGFEAGRTAGAVAALRVLGGGDDDLVARAEAYLSRNAARVPHGHASPALHLLAGALAQHALGRKRSAEGAYARAFDDVLDDVARCQKRDGTFRDLVPHSPDSLAVLGHTVQDTAYLTALYACALAVERSEVARLLRGAASSAGGKERRVARGAAEPAPIWCASVGSVAGLELEGGQLLVVSADGTVRRFHAGTGTQAADPMHLAVAPGRSVRAAWSAGGLLLCLDAPESGWRKPVRIVNGVADTKPPELGLSAVRVEDGRSVWNRRLRGTFQGVGRAGDELLLTSRVAAPQRVRLRDGKELGELRAPPGVVNRALAVASDGRIAVTGEAELWVLSAERKLLWRRKARSRRGLLAPAKCALVWSGDRLVEGTTGGLVRCRDGSTGRTVWKQETGAAVQALAAGDGEILALGWDGAVVCFESEGTVRWRADPANGEETGAPGILQVAGRHAGAAGPCGALRVFELATGHVAASYAVGPQDAWQLGDKSVFIARDDELQAFAMSRG